MKNVYRSFSWIMLVGISLFAGFTANIDKHYHWESYSPSEMAGVHRIKVHALRHSHASMLIAMGENALVVQSRLFFDVCFGHRGRNYWICHGGTQLSCL